MDQMTKIRIQDLAKYFGVSRHTIQRHMKKLGVKRGDPASMIEFIAAMRFLHE